MHQFDLSNVRPAEAVDRLLGVPHDEQPPDGGPNLPPVHWSVCQFHSLRHVLGQEHRKFRLKRIGVLDLVDEYVRVAFPEVVACGDAVPQQIARQHKQVLELHFPGGLSLVGIIKGEASQQFEHRNQHRVPLALGGLVRGHVERSIGQQIIVPVETDRDFANVTQGHTFFERGAKCLLSPWVVERRVEPLRPFLLERYLRLDRVTDVESRRQARLERTFAQEAACEAVQRLNSGLVEIVYRALATLTLRVLSTRIGADPFEGLSYAGTQLGGGSLRERDSGDAAHARPSGRYERCDSLDEAPRLAGARTRLDDHVLIEAFDDCVPCQLV